MRHKTAALILMGICVILAATALTLGLRLYGGAGTAEQPPQGYTDQAAAPDTAAVPADQDASGSSAAQPAAAQEPTFTPEPTEEPWAGPLVEEQPIQAPAAYFADAGFIGNSVLSGLWLYNNDLLLPSDPSHWFWQDSLTIMGASPFAAQMADYDFGKIYIEFGINELNYDQDTLREAFNAVIDRLQDDHPDAILYLMSVTPVSAYCDANRPFKQGTVIAFNNMLQDIAREQHIWYLDVYPVLCGPDGYLPSDVTPDGVHFNPAHYQLWFDYLKTHYVSDGVDYYALPEATPEQTPAEDAGGTGAEVPVG